MPEPAPRLRFLPRAAAAFVCAGLVLAAPAAARAEPASVRDALPAAAQRAFDEGATLYRAGRAEAARERFLAAHRESGDARVLYNVAVCEKALGRFAAAIGTLRRSKDEGGATLAADYVQKVDDALATLASHVGTVALEANVAGARFTVDGEPAAASTVPVDPGPHVIGASKAGFEAATTQLVAKAGVASRASLVLVPRALPGSLQVRCADAPRCDVRLGDEPLGRAPVSVTRAPGRYRVRVTAGGRELASTEVELVAGETADLVVPGRPPVARLRVTTDREGDTITIDGEQSGRSGAAFEVSPGEHRVVVGRPGGASRFVDVRLAEDETRDLYTPWAEEKRPGRTTFWIVGGAVVAVAIGAIVTGVVLANRSTRFEGEAAGTLNPYVVPAARPAWGKP